MSKVASEDNTELILLTKKSSNILRTMSSVDESKSESSKSGGGADKDDEQPKEEGEFIAMFDQQKNDPIGFKEKLAERLEERNKKQQQQQQEELEKEMEKRKEATSDGCVIEFDWNNKIKLVRKSELVENERDEEESDRLQRDIELDASTIINQMDHESSENQEEDSSVKIESNKANESKTSQIKDDDDNDDDDDDDDDGI